MPDPEIERAAQFLAGHAILLLGVSLLALVAALGGVMLAARVALRYRERLWGGLQAAVDIMPLRRLWPSGYLLVHLALGLVLSLGCVTFLVIAEEVFGGGELAAFDVAFARALRESATPAWRELMAVATRVGDGLVITAASIAVMAVLIARDHRLIAIAWGAAQAGGGLLMVTLKNLFERTRPEYADPIFFSSGFSFPSGHAMGTFVFCGMGAYVMARLIRSWPLRALLVTVALAWWLVIGFSRLYLGVHFVSDVIAGFVGGAIWLAVCVSGTEVALRRRAARGRAPARDAGARAPS